MANGLEGQEDGLSAKFIQMCPPLMNKQEGKASAKVKSRQAGKQGKRIV